MPILEEGAQAPDFTVQTHEGKTVSLKDFRGKHVILWFYPKADTPGCTIEGCEFRDSFASYAAKGVQILGASFDTPAENKAFVEKFGFQFPLLCDTDRKIGLAYGAAEKPDDGYPKRVSFLIDPTGKIARVWGKVSPKGHAADVLSSVT